MRNFTIALTAASLMLSGAALAQSSNDIKTNSETSNATGDTSGSAKGGNVNPSTAVQKQGRSSSDFNSPAGGSPGVEGPAGSKNGPAAK